MEFFSIRKKTKKNYQIKRLSLEPDLSIKVFSYPVNIISFGLQIYDGTTQAKA